MDTGGGSSTTLDAGGGGGGAEERLQKGERFGGFRRFGTEATSRKVAECAYKNETGGDVS